MPWLRLSGVYLAQMHLRTHVSHPPATCENPLDSDLRLRIRKGAAILRQTISVALSPAQPALQPAPASRLGLRPPLPCARARAFLGTPPRSTGRGLLGASLGLALDAASLWSFWGASNFIASSLGSHAHP